MTLVLPPTVADYHRQLGIPATYAAERGLPFHAEADEASLVEVAVSPDGRPIKLTPPAADAWRRLQAAAAVAGVPLIPVSGFRSLARQARIVRDKLAAGRTLEEIFRYVAAPGFSEHHTGRAIDVGTPGHLDLEEDFAETPAFAWLASHAAGYGFQLSYPRGTTHGIGYEPWPWRRHPASPA